ncbi:complement C1q tumor necrosis factor-related protein 3-like [Ostrea edulis]|uniref:complement C1q tumor necrosis factor-related protein 3-like n=1 Tax=Ostrea edulis TaxID=37623 RepID=UPI0024AF5050|nr:complement C1q tumor necrosis factor-related protein 3-like [Ostrea edulis]
MEELVKMVKNDSTKWNDIENILNDLKVQIRYTSLSLLDVNAETNSVNADLLQSLNQAISDLYDFSVKMLKKVAFTASVPSTSPSWNTGTLVFSVVITNVGNGYNPSNGIFTAPTNGNYVFFVNVQSYGTKIICVDIVLNGSTKVRTMAFNNIGSGDSYDAGPNLVVLTLQKGDSVWVRYYAGKGYFTDGYMTTFSGFLI